MDDQYEIVCEEKPEEEAWGVIGRGVAGYNRRQAGDNQFQRLCFTLRTPEGAIAGGVLAESYWNWLYIDLLWVEEALRGQGYGRRLMLTAEEEGRKRGAKNAYLDTFSFQAPGFYEKLGYEVFGELPDFPAGHGRFFMKKAL
jgi:ribosomal protein S18 acetylase RimI-like enzyme